MPRSWSHSRLAAGMQTTAMLSVAPDHMCRRAVCHSDSLEYIVPSQKKDQTPDVHTMIAIPVSQHGSIKPTTDHPGSLHPEGDAVPAAMRLLHGNCPLVRPAWPMPKRNSGPKRSHRTHEGRRQNMHPRARALYGVALGKRSSLVRVVAVIMLAAASETGDGGSLAIPRPTRRPGA